MALIENHLEKKIEDLPFTVEKVDDHLLLSTKPKGHLNKQKRMEFEKNKVILKVELFDMEYFERINNIKIKLKSNITILDSLRNFHERLLAFLSR